MGKLPVAPWAEKNGCYYFLEGNIALAPEFWNSGCSPVEEAGRCQKFWGKNTYSAEDGRCADAVLAVVAGRLGGSTAMCSLWYRSELCKGICYLLSQSGFWNLSLHDSALFEQDDLCLHQIHCLWEQGGIENKCFLFFLESNKSLLKIVTRFISFSHQHIHW